MEQCQHLCDINTFSKDLEQALITYLWQRPVQYYELVDINTKSLTFYDNVTIDYTGKSMIIPTKISIIKGYNFDTDSQKIKQTMIDQIVGLPHAQAQKTHRIWCIWSSYYTNQS